MNCHNGYIDLRGYAFSTPAPKELERQIANLSLENSGIEEEILQVRIGVLMVQHDMLRDLSFEIVSTRECDGNYRGMNRSVIWHTEIKTPKFDGSCEIKECFV